MSSSLAPGGAVVLPEVLCSLRRLVGLSARTPFMQKRGLVAGPHGRNQLGCSFLFSPGFYEVFSVKSAHVEDFGCVSPPPLVCRDLTTLLNMQQVVSYCFCCSILSLMKLPPLDIFPFNVSARDLMERSVTVWICPRGENYCRLEGTKLSSRRVCIDCCSVG